MNSCSLKIDLTWKWVDGCKNPLEGIKYILLAIPIDSWIILAWFGRKVSQVDEVERNLTKFHLLPKLAIHLLFLVFRHVCALFRKLFREIANQSIYTSHNIANFAHLWFCKKLDEKLAVSFSLMFHENTDHLVGTAKRKMRKMIGEMVYKMSSIHFSFLPFRKHLFAFSSVWR